MVWGVSAVSLIEPTSFACEWSAAAVATRRGEVADDARMTYASPSDDWVAALRERSPSAETAVTLDALDPERMTARGRIDALVVLEQHMAWLQAKQVEVLAAIAAHTETPEAVIVDAGGSLDEVFAASWDGAVEEVACALRLANQTAAQRLRTATLLAGRHQATARLLGEGQISYLQAMAVAEQLEVLDDEVAGQVEAVLVSKMPVLAVGQTRAALRREIHRADPEGAESRHRVRVKERRVLHHPQDDGMALFGAVLPAQQAALMEQAVDACAVAYERDGRTLEQKRADALFDLVVNQPGASAVGRLGLGAPQLWCR